MNCSDISGLTGDGGPSVTMSLRQAALALGLDDGTIRRAVDSGQLPSVMIGKRARVMTAAVEELRGAYNAKQLAALLGVSAPTVYRATADGQLPAKRLATKILYPRAAVAQLLAGAA
ncbi:helix-turn-helix domain-containing protein [Streptomyces sp. NPDC048507]|uniref:helix-turn-helix domain-containing protein n=1 Tax=Streptomyces sp. NPDC048507 TaxID=3365560 RepID=UPI00371DBAEA